MSYRTLPKIPGLRRVSSISQSRNILFLLLISATALQVIAQQYSLDWFRIAGGGGTSTSGRFALSGTIGQHDAAGALTGGNFSLTGGFWSLASVLQTPGAPALFITHSGTTVTVFWQDLPGWSLQQSTNLALGGAWANRTGATTSNGTNYLNLASPGGNLFFRLQHP